MTCEKKEENATTKGLSEINFVSPTRDEGLLQRTVQLANQMIRKQIISTKKRILVPYSQPIRKNSYYYKSSWLISITLDFSGAFVLLLDPISSKGLSIITHFHFLFFSSSCSSHCSDQEKKKKKKKKT